MDLLNAFKIGAQRIAKDQKRYADLHKSHGIEESHWNLITSREYWTPDESRAVRSILANVVEVSMTIAGLPAIQLPGQYVAAVIAEVVSPCNWAVAALKAPDTFDAFDASGLAGPTEQKPMEWPQMFSLVLAYGGAYGSEPVERIPAEVVEQVSKANTSTRTKKPA